MIQTQPKPFIPETFIVIADGELDNAYYDQIYAAKRREALQQVFEPLARNAGALLINGSLWALKSIGGATLQLMEAAAQAGKESQL